MRRKVVMAIFTMVLSLLLTGCGISEKRELLKYYMEFDTRIVYEEFKLLINPSEEAIIRIEELKRDPGSNYDFNNDEELVVFKMHIAENGEREKIYVRFIKETGAFFSISYELDEKKIEHIRGSRYFIYKDKNKVGNYANGNLIDINNKVDQSYFIFKDDIRGEGINYRNKEIVEGIIERLDWEKRYEDHKEIINEILKIREGFYTLEEYEENNERVVTISNNSYNIEKLGLVYKADNKLKELVYKDRYGKWVKMKKEKNGFIYNANTGRIDINLDNFEELKQYFNRKN